jgi:excisionase family DNA binding protein
LVDRMLTVSEVADLLRVHSSSVRRWQKSGELKSYRLGSKGSLRFKNEDILSFLQAASRADIVSGARQSLPEKGTAN